ncbi:MAG: hypothetical protein ACLPXB_12515 [Thiobacillaceae bacterium]
MTFPLGRSIMLRLGLSRLPLGYFLGRTSRLSMFSMSVLYVEVRLTRYLKPN